MARTDAEVKEYCDVICDESDRMMSMILRMMELFRLESGTVEMVCEEFDLADLLDYVTEIFTIEIEREKIVFKRTIPAVSILLRIISALSRWSPTMCKCGVPYGSR